MTAFYTFIAGYVLACIVCWISHLEKTRDLRQQLSIAKSNNDVLMRKPQPLDFDKRPDEGENCSEILRSALNQHLFDIMERYNVGPHKAAQMLRDALVRLPDLKIEAGFHLNNNQ